MSARDWFMVLSVSIILSAFVYLLWRTWPSSEPPMWARDRVVGRVLGSTLTEGGLYVEMQIDDSETARQLFAGVGTSFSVGPLDVDDRSYENPANRVDFVSEKLPTMFGFIPNLDREE
jgi:hypothetical protein